jgi:aryl-alcohol dehydrogenase-like predicted oxidoreductase
MTSSPIPGCKTLRHLEDDLGAAEIELSEEELARLNALATADPAIGAREQVTRV